MKNFLRSKLYIIVFIIVIALPLFQSYTKLFNDSLLNEKRNLTAKPIYNKEEPLSKFINDYEKYFNDTLGFREYLIRLSNYIDVNVFKKSPNEKVVLGKEDYIYSSEELDDYNKVNTLSDEDINKIADNILTFQENLAKRGIYFVFTVAPNKSTIYPEYMPSASINPNGENNLSKLERAVAEKQINYIDYKGLMLDNKSSYDLYYKRDTHWNRIAATLAANELIKSLSGAYDIGDFYINPTNIKEEFRQGDLDELLGITSPTLELNCDIDTNIPNSKLPKTLVYHDSFFNDVLPVVNSFFTQRLDMHHTRTPITNTFELYNGNTQVVVFEMVERYLPQLVNYNFDIFDSNFDLVQDYPSTKLNLDMRNNNTLEVKNMSFYPYEDYYSYSTLSNDSSLTWSVDNKKVDYILLELNDVKYHENLILSWAKDQEDFKEEQQVNILLQPNKNKYLIKVNNPMNISKFRVETLDKLNIDVNIKRLELISLPD